MEYTSSFRFTTREFVFHLSKLEVLICVDDELSKVHSWGAPIFRGYAAKKVFQKINEIIGSHVEPQTFSAANVNVNQSEAGTISIKGIELKHPRLRDVRICRVYVDEVFVKIENRNVRGEIKGPLWLLQKVLPVFVLRQLAVYCE
jgi:hypothetical protein